MPRPPASHVPCRYRVKKGSTTHFTSVDAIQAAIYTDGSVSASFNVYDASARHPQNLRRAISDSGGRYNDFMNYYSGVYIPDTTSGLLGGHCVKIVGWGEDAGVCRMRLPLRRQLMPLRAVQVCPTGPSPTRGALAGVRTQRCLRRLCHV